MKHRCDNGHKNYGSRGITYCDRWKDFINFFEDMGEPPKGLSLERDDNDKGYSKENCFWATKARQQANRRSTTKTGFKGVTVLPSGRYQVCMKVRGVPTYLGSFDTPEGASKVYQAKWEELHGR